MEMIYHSSSQLNFCMIIGMELLIACKRFVQEFDDILEIFPPNQTRDQVTHKNNKAD